jgi:hypothetical protein
MRVLKDEGKELPGFQGEGAEMKVRNKETGEVFTDTGSFVLDAQKRYNRMDNLVYCDIECIIKDPEDESQYYVLDECGNWSYFPSDLYEVVK